MNFIRSASSSNSFTRILALAAIFALALSATSPLAAQIDAPTPLPTTVWVDDAWAALADGTDVGLSRTIGGNAFATIQGAVNAVAAAGTIHVAEGDYEEDVVVDRAVTILGAGATSIVTGPIGGGGATFQFASDGVVLDGFTITRAGNNTTDWNNPGLNSAGVAIQSRTSGTVRNCTIIGLRTGIDINNSTGISVHNNAIDNNRTGLIFRNVTDGCEVFQNSISGNWTVGVLFLDASSGSNAPAQTANEAVFSGNAIAGNWYGQIVDRQTGGSLPAPGANLKNFSRNWLGTLTPVIATTNSVEPGYAAQIPAAFGGTATAPGGQPDVCGVASANFDITPMLESGLDTNIDLGNGLVGFQGNDSVLMVTDELAQTGSAGRVTEGAALVAMGGTVHVQAGVYVENASIAKRCTIEGAGSGGNGPATAANTVVQALSASSPAISIAATGLSAGNRLVLKNLRTIGATSSDGIAMAVTPCDYLHIEAVTSVGNTNGIHFGVSSGSTNDVEITNCVLSSNANAGLRIASAMSSATALSVTGGEMKSNNVHGFEFNPAIVATCFGDEFTIDGTVFTDNGSSVAGNGSGHVSLVGFNGSATLKDLTLSGTAFNPIQLRGKTPSAPLGTVAFENVVVSGATRRPAVYIQVYTSLANLSFSGLNLSGMSSSNAPGGFFSNGGMILDHTGPSVSLGNTIFPGQGPGYKGFSLGNSGGAIADCSTVFGGATTLAQKEESVLDGQDVAGLGDVAFGDAYASVPPVGGTVCEGSPFTFNVTAGGDGPLSYQWRRGGSPIPGAQSPSYMIPAAAIADQGSYDVEITNACGSEISPAALLNVTPLPSAPSSASSTPPSVCFGAGGDIALSVSGGSGTTLEWFTASCGGTAIGTGNGLSIPAPTATTTYHARWTSTCGTTGCASVTVFVQLPPAANAGGSYSTCDVTPVALGGTALDYSSVLWTTSGSGSFANAGDAVTTYTPSSADATLGFVTLTLTANPIAPCLPVASSVATLTLASQSSWYQDADNDGFGNSAVTLLACVQPSGYVLDNTDCNDTNPLVKPGATEVCNGIDDDCDNQIDEVCALNDHCTGATAITNGAISGDNASAGSEITDLSAGPVVSDVWYSYTNTLTCPKTVTVSMCPSDGGGASFDAVLHAFSGTCGALTLLASNDNMCGTNPKVSFTVAGSATAYIAVSAKAPGTGGPFTMLVKYESAKMITLGLGCSEGPGPGPSLALNAVPVLGAVRTLTITDAAPNAPGAIFISELPAANQVLPGGCTLYLADSMQLLVLFTTDATGGFSVTSTVPNDPALECGMLRVQAAAFPAGGVPLYQATNGLELLFGY